MSFIRVKCSVEDAVFEGREILINPLSISVIAELDDMVAVILNDGSTIKIEGNIDSVENNINNNTSIGQIK